MSTKFATIAASSTARKVVGSLGVIGAAAAVAGVGTFGTFTDSSTPANTTIDTATLDINAAAVGESIPVTTAGFVPGDSLTRAVNLVNSGTAALGSVNLNTTVAAASVLTTDFTNGLQLTVKSCSVPWTQGGVAGAPTYSCSGTTQVLGAGPVVSSINLANAASLAPGGTDYLTFSVSLPTTADNTFQGKTAALSLTFVGSQRTGTAR
ncbi:TasA family protein [Blastococcus deserti]|uniref:TasA family protein n=1 Tax=Blastococcus deserti TaxID=2259033 RepID=A0ABW4XEZ3_9ACTN